jgi:hypothetical protein
MDGCFGRRQPKNQPAMSRIDVPQAQDVAKERPVRVGVGRVEQDVCSINHVSTLQCPA